MTTLMPIRATPHDAPQLAAMNRQLIQDEGHRNPMTLPELEARMRGWLEGDYEAVLFQQSGETVAYALFRHNGEEIYLRQLFVARDKRRQGIGRRAMELLFAEVWPAEARITVEVLVKNRPAHAFWRAVGFQDYAVTLERMPGGGE